MDAKEQALTNLTAAAAEARMEAQAHLAAGAHPDAVGIGLARALAGASPAVMTAHVAAVVAGAPAAEQAGAAAAVLSGLTDEGQKAAVLTGGLAGLNPGSLSAEQLAVLERLLAAARGTAPPNPPG
ncbi:hypothetical protein GobsT_11990 [Gemmata obscuriglobus]|uniref:hypothetical protein n=1 Tax=Gemmata TaxID=113 RepID=UPI0011CCFF68|nr:MULTISPECIES: hypothetical protein [Gemmata]MDY3554781.1 hypothetical protein [Gemmata algarum]QEG26460.1 hypothetical protein GobsT_11990 [Gemmata obscuriglobus]VTS01668.1 unnamed protein product [Gemmata obscuriglobus UQM 2246]